LNDNRAAGGVKEEQDVGICPHCQKVIRLQQWQVAGTNQRGWCMRCMAPCCGTGPCAEEFMRAGCLPFVKKIDMLLTQEHAKAQFRRLAGLEPEPPPTFIRSGMT
jgi:hypothetical protein